MSKSFSKAIEDRRTYYAISKDSVVPDDDILKIIHHAVRYAPSAFNSQSARLLVLLGDEHDKVWEITKDALLKLIGAERFPKTEEKLNTFQSGYGTILYFEDQNTVKGMQENFPTYKDNFPLWSLQSAGMLQFIIWTSLEEAGFGASLQHYNPLIDDAVKKQWNIPQEWVLLAEMPFGKPTAGPGEKTFLPLEDRVKVYK